MKKLNDHLSSQDHFPESIMKKLNDHLSSQDHFPNKLVLTISMLMFLVFMVVVWFDYYIIVVHLESLPFIDRVDL